MSSSDHSHAFDDDDQLSEAESHAHAALDASDDADAEGGDGDDRSPIDRLIGNTKRQRLLFGAMVMALLLLTLLFYTPQQQGGLLCGSKQALRARANANVINARSWSEVRAMQEQARLNGGRASNAFNSVAAAGDGMDPATMQPPPTSIIAAALQPFLLPLAAPFAPRLWARKEFTPPAPAGGPMGRSTDYPDAPTPEQTQANYRRWEGELTKLVAEHKDKGGVPAAIRAFLSPAVDQLPIRAAPLRAVDQAVVMVLVGGGVGVEPRDPGVLFTLRHAMHLLGPGWGLVVFHAPEDEDWLAEQLQTGHGQPGEHIELQRVHVAGDKAAPSPLALSSVFLERVRVETMLLLAPNAVLLRSPHLDGPSSSRDGWNHLLSGFVTLASPWPWCKEEWCQLGGTAGASMRKRSVMSVVGSEVLCADWECVRQDIFGGSSAPTDGDADAWKGEETFVAKMVHRHQARWKGLLPGPKENAAFAQSQVQVDDVEVRSGAGLAALGGSDSSAAQLSSHLLILTVVFASRCCLGTRLFSLSPLLSLRQPFFVHKIWDFQPESRWLPLVAHVKQYYPEINK